MLVGVTSFFAVIIVRFFTIFYSFKKKNWRKLCQKALKNYFGKFSLHLTAPLLIANVFRNLLKIFLLDKSNKCTFKRNQFLGGLVQLEFLDGACVV